MQSARLVQRAPAERPALVSTRLIAAFDTTLSVLYDISRAVSAAHLSGGSTVTIINAKIKSSKWIGHEKETALKLPELLGLEN